MSTLVVFTKKSFKDHLLRLVSEENSFFFSWPSKKQSFVYDTVGSISKLDSIDFSLYEKIVFFVSPWFQEAFPEFPYPENSFIINESEFLDSPEDTYRSLCSYLDLRFGKSLFEKNLEQNKDAIDFLERKLVV